MSVCYYLWDYEVKNDAFLTLPVVCNNVRVSPGSAETLARTGGITNDHVIAYSLSNISAKNYQNRLMSVEVIVQRQFRFFETQCILSKSVSSLSCYSFEI